jgi:caffeoyl-CoA O-methyltransferase
MSELPRVRPVADREMEAYATAHSTAPSAQLAAVDASTRTFSDLSEMMVGALEGRLLALLVSLTRAQRILEVGTFTGYSAISMAQAMSPGGRITTLELSPEHAVRSRLNITEAGVASVIDVIEGPALESLAGLTGPFDMTFIDADKAGYPAYYDLVVPLMAPGGLIVADNVLRQGRVLEGSDRTPDIAGLREFNAKVVADPRVECVMLTVRDGVTLIRRRN